MNCTPLVLALALFTTVGASAQGTTAPTKTAASDTKATTDPKAAATTVTVDHTCFLASNDATWKSVGTSADVTARIKTIQEKCKADCSALKATDTSGAKQAGAMNSSIKTIQDLLTADQKTKWSNWCKVSGPKPVK